MPRTGFIFLHRKSLYSDAFPDDVLWKAWTTCLMLANWEPKNDPFGNLTETIALEPGQFVTGQQSFFKACYQNIATPPVSSRTLWRKLVLLEKMGNLIIETTNKYSIVTIKKWADYQKIPEDFVKHLGGNLAQSWSESVKEIVKQSLAGLPMDSEAYQGLVENVVKVIVTNLSSSCQADVKQIDNNKEDKKTIKKEKKDSCTQKAQSAPKKRPVPFPPDFVLTDKHREYAKANGYHKNLDDLFESFRLHYCAKGSAWTDWDLVLMKWIRNEVSAGKGGAQPMKEAQKPEPDGIKAVTFDDPAFQRWEKIQKERENAAAAVG